MGNSYRKGLMFSLGPISTSVDLVTVAPERKSGLNRLCPDHTVKLSQKYHCPGTTDADAHDVVWETWNMGIATADGYKVVNKEERPKFDAAGGLTLTPVPRKDLEAATLEGNGLYYASPNSPHAEATWAIFRKLVNSSKTALIARGALRKGSEKLWRLTTFNNYLVLREIRFPENLKPSPEAVTAKVDKDTYELVTQFAEKLSKEWDEYDATDTMAVRMEEWLGGGTEIEAGEVADEAPPAVDLKTLLAEAIADAE